MHRTLLFVAFALGAGCSLGLDFDRDYPAQGGALTGDAAPSPGADTAPPDGGAPPSDAALLSDADLTLPDAAPPDVQRGCRIACDSLAACLRRAQRSNADRACPGLQDPPNAAFFSGACAALCVNGQSEGLEPGARFDGVDCAPYADTQDFADICEQGTMCSRQCAGVTPAFGLCTPAGLGNQRCANDCARQREGYWYCLGWAAVLLQQGGNPLRACDPYQACVGEYAN